MSLAPDPGQETFTTHGISPSGRYLAIRKTLLGFKEFKATSNLEHCPSAR